MAKERPNKMRDLSKFSQKSEAVSEAYLHRLYLKELASTELLIKTKKQYFDVATQRKITFLYSYHHLELYSALTQCDLSVLIKRYRIAKRAHEKSLYARMIAMTAIEFFEDINTLIGRDLLKELSITYFEDFVPVFKNINKKFGQLRKENEILLRQIRNNSSAHKSLDSLKFLELTYDIDTDKIYLLGISIKVLSVELAVELVKLSGRLLTFMTEVFKLFDEVMKKYDGNPEANIPDLNEEQR